MSQKAQGALIIAAGISLLIIGYILQRDTGGTESKQRASNRLVGWGIALTTGGVSVLLGRQLIDSENRQSAKLGLIVLGCLSLGGSLFLLGYAVLKPDYRWLSLTIGAGLLFAGSCFLISARRLKTWR